MHASHIHPPCALYACRSINCKENATNSFFSIVKRFIEEDRLPHLLFYGPPGTGKTSTILAVAKQIYSAREFNSMVLEVGIYLKMPGLVNFI